MANSGRDRKIAGISDPILPIKSFWWKKPTTYHRFAVRLNRIQKQQISSVHLKKSAIRQQLTQKINEELNKTRDTLLDRNVNERWKSFTNVLKGPSKAEKLWITAESLL
ncbi:hypothetical protein ILUMI_13974 [Ignelater luminosus]|uniref:Uncharacterized protein n=1 Tax=Ignelater luminosus TaxID=2038154 RepID=A0A8K0GBD9_IGNLU|nr:hypothetical protein ILUMI_13974 [Ignelater luminosus]